MKFRRLLLPLLLLALAGCDYEVPLTPTPTHGIEPRLIGDWIAADKDNGKEESMHVRAWDEANYAVAMDRDIYRAYHSDFAGQSFLSVQDLNSGRHTWCIYTWALSADGNTLVLRHVDTKVVPEDLKRGTELQQRIKDNLTNPKLLSAEIRFTRRK